jgi:transcriptional regulator with XRE-family HTH domain
VNANEAADLIERIGIERIQRSLRSWREGVQLSQEELAELAGVAQQTISRLEKGTRNLTPEVFARIMNVIDEAHDKQEKRESRGVPLRSLLGGEVTRDWFAQKEHEAQRVRDAERAKVTQDRIKDRLIEALDKLVNIQNELIAAHTELRHAEAKKREELEQRIAEYRDLLGLETDAAVARSNADERREKILSTKGKADG